MVEAIVVTEVPVNDHLAKYSADDVLASMEKKKAASMFENLNNTDELETTEEPSQAKGTTIAAEAVKRVYYRDKIYSVEALQQRLMREMERLEWQLDQVAQAPMGSRQVLANTYKDMIKKRKELFESLD